MDLEIKKNLTSNWFKMLQNAICHSINDLKKIILNLNQQLGKEIQKKMKEVENIEF